MATKKKKLEYVISDRNLALLKACIDGDSAALLVGETGTGKTTIIRELAKEQGKNLVRVSVNGSMGVEEILGKWLVDKGTTVWQDGILTAALRKGDWVVMDEINAALPEILFTLHSLLDDDRKITLAEKDNEVVYPVADFRFFATMNPSEEYAGTKDMNKALISRFTAVLNVDVLVPGKEARLLIDKGATKEIAFNLVSLAQKLRDYKRKEYIFYFCSTRDLVQAVNLIKAGLSFADALHGAICNKMPEKEFKVVEKEFTAYITLTPDVEKMDVERILWIAENHEKEINVYRSLSEELKKDCAAQIAKAKKDAEGMTRAQSDEVTAELLEKLQKVAKI